jgi:Glycine zipper
MKKYIYLLIFSAASFAACKPKADLNSKKEMVSLSDSALYNSSYLSDTGAVANPDEFINSGAVVSGKSTIPEKKPGAKNNTPTGSNNGSYGNSSGSSSGSGTGSSTAATTPAKKKGISKAAQGAIIGGVGGAVAGGVIGKNAKGAGIGAAIGAAGGYIIGRSKDKKDGRVRN